MINRAKGEFEVNIVPQTDRDISNLARMTIDKQFRGDLETTSIGQMLSAGTTIKNSAAYVAIERVEGLLHGRKGSFILQHVGIMNKGESSLTVTVVPDSGTDSLIGLIGNMSINIIEGKHLYNFNYTLPDAK